MHKQLRILGYGSIIPIAVLLLWGLVSYSGYIQPFFIPTPTAVFGTIVTEMISGDLWPHMVISCFRATLGFLLAALLAYPVGAFMGINRLFSNLFEPFNDLIRYMPVPAFIPLLILWFGIGITTQIAVIFVGTFFQLTIMIQDAFANVQKAYLETGRSLSFSKAEMLRSVYIPASLPQSYDALRITVGWAWSYLILAEIVGASKGLGFMIVEAQRFLKTPKVIAGIIIIGSIGLITDLVLRKLKRFVVPWTITHS